MKVIIFISLIFLAGCLPENITNKEFKKAKEICAKNGGFKYLWKGRTESIHVNCVNGASFTVSVSNE